MITNVQSKKLVFWKERNCNFSRLLVHHTVILVWKLTPTRSNTVLTYLEHMESLKLNVSALISQHVHHEFEVLWVADVLCHYSEVVSVQQQFTQELQYAVRELNIIASVLHRTFKFWTAQRE